MKIVPAVADDLSLAEAERTRGRAFAAAALDARAVAHLADAAQGHRRGAGGGPAARRRRDGAGAHRLCGRPADAGRGDPRVSTSNGARRAARRAMAAAARRRRAAAPPRRASMPPRGAPRGALAPAQLVDRAGAGHRRRCAPSAAAAPTLASRQLRGRWSRSPPRSATSLIKAALERDVRLVRFEDGKLEIALEPSARQDAGQRSVAQALSNGPAGAGWWWSRREAGRADAEVADRRAQGRARAAACAPIRWCRRCWRAFPAPRSSACAARRRAPRPPRRPSRRRAAARRTTTAPDDDGRRREQR